MNAILSLMPRDRSAWFVLAGVAGVILGGVVIVLGPVNGRFAQMNEAVVSQEKKLARNLGVLAPQARDAVEREYGRFGSVIKMRGSSEEENAQMLSEIDKWAGQNKIKLSATKPRETRKDQDCEYYSVEVEVEANMTELIGFIYALESSPQLLRVERLTLDAKGGKQQDSMRGTLVISKVVTL